MDFPLKVRFAVGPGIPFQLSKMQSPDAHRATLEAVFELLSMGSIPAGYIAKATHGSTTACVSLNRAHVFSEPRGSVPTTHVEEYELVVELETPDDAKLRAEIGL